MCLHKGTVQFVLCIGVALAGLPLARGQELAPPTLRELSKTTKATPTPSPDKPRSKGSIEISAATPNEKPAPFVEQTPPPEELATPAATPEKKNFVQESVQLCDPRRPNLPRQLRRHYRPQKLWQLAPLFPITRTKRGAPMFLATASAL
jgi:hypothetical protein